MRVAVINPLTKERWERLGILFEKSEKDELTLEEADEILDLQENSLKSTETEEKHTDYTYIQQLSEH
jgi:hypothetical protein